MIKTQQSSRLRRFSAQEKQNYILPKLFFSVDVYQKQQHSVKIVSNQAITNITLLSRNTNYQITNRSYQSEMELMGIQENNKAYEVKITVKYIKHKQRLQKQFKQDILQDYKSVRFPNKSIKYLNDEIELSRKLQYLLAKIDK